MNRDRNELALDLINILSFIVGIINLDKNDEQINQLEEHLSKQDRQYEEIIKLLTEMKGDAYDRQS